VFPNGSLWLVGDADVLLVASAEPVSTRVARISDAWGYPDVARDLASVGVETPYSVISLFVTEGQALAGWAAGAPLQTDNRAALEFSGPRSIFGVTRDDNALALRELARQSKPPDAVAQAMDAGTPADWLKRATMLLKAEAARPAFNDFAGVLDRLPDDEVALDGLVRSAATANRIPDAEALLTRLASDPARQPAKLALSRVLASRGNVEDAVRIPLAILQGDNANVPALGQLASVLADMGDAGRLEPVVARLMGQAPRSSWSHYYAATLAYLQNRPDQALRSAQTAVALDPTNAKAHNLVGACLASLGNRNEARKAFEASLKADPREPGTYINLATLELQSGNRDRAVQYFSEALAIEPTNGSATEGLQTALGHPIR
jgi:tetratricopeptide (TPR) repeat protein